MKIIINKELEDMIEEHKALVPRLNKLADKVYNPDEAASIDSNVEFANKAVQLSAMRKYEESLRARLENKDVLCMGNGTYFVKVPEHKFGSDFDIDKEKNV